MFIFKLSCQIYDSFYLVVKRFPMVLHGDLEKGMGLRKDAQTQEQSPNEAKAGLERRKSSKTGIGFRTERGMGLRKHDRKTETLFFRYRIISSQSWEA